MLKIKYLPSVILISILLLSACDKDSTPPVIQISNGEKISKHLKDTIKYYNAIQVLDYPFLVEITDENAVSINITSHTPQDIPVHFNHNDAPQASFPIGGYTASKDKLPLPLILKNIPRPTAGSHEKVRIDVEGVDDCGQDEEAVLELHIVGNHVPIAELYVSEATIPYDTPFGMALDGCDSREEVEDYGGMIEKYKFTISKVLNGIAQPPFYTYEDNSCAINYEFPGSGTFTVKLSVMDNDGVCSPTIDTTITIQ